MDKKNWDKQDNVVKIIALATLILLVLAINIMSPNFFAKVWTLATSGNIESTVEFLASYGIWAIAISFLLVILQRTSLSAKTSSITPIRITFSFAKVSV